MSNFEYLLLFATDKRNWKKSKKSFEIRNYMSSKNNSQKNPPYNNNSNNTIFGSKRYGKKNYGCPQSALFCRMLAQDIFFLLSLLSLPTNHGIYIRTVSSERIFFAFHNWFKQVYGHLGRATCTVHWIWVPQVESFYSVKYWSSIILSNVRQIISVMKTKTLVIFQK